MIRLNVTAEGFSEELFVQQILRPHLLNFNIYTEVRKSVTNKKLQARGGLVSYLKFKNDVQRWFKECPDVYHTCFIDLYGITTDFPGFTESNHLQPYSRVAEMERQLAKDLDFYKFIPYIQLHEYETLLFSNTEVVEEWLSLFNKIPEGSFAKIVKDAPDSNPELINEGRETAPSKRIEKICEAYDKKDDGVLLLKEIGLPTIRTKCKHFHDWLTKLEGLK